MILPVGLKVYKIGDIYFFSIYFSPFGIIYIISFFVEIPLGIFLGLTPMLDQLVV